LSPELSNKWFFRDVTGRSWGQNWETVVEFCRSADLFVHISGSCNMREEYFTPARVVFIDSDPVYTQALIPDYVAGRLSDPDLLYRMTMLLKHDVFFTFAENIAHPDCRVPRQLVNWVPTRQPIVIDRFQQSRFQLPPSSRRQVLTTVMSWDPHEKGPTVDGVTYAGKSGEFLQFVDLPRQAAAPLEIAISGRPPREQMLAAGWKLIDGYQVSSDPWSYREYLANSLAEWSVAKNAYVRSRSGWFSCRTACYLALGIPAIVQDTGFGCALPTGEGILPFSTVDEARGHIESLVADPRRHERAALEIVYEYFDSSKILSRLIDEAA
ncbi:MAG: glycosyltransferase family 1 protein, partial [Deltaproteobacteria bacterium]|nr:glycosyltransferase family 1 protein [Deltaproteobacteria bacterium]